jgi:hypothetical protein
MNPIERFWITRNGVRINFANRGDITRNGVRINFAHRGDDVVIPYGSGVEMQHEANALGFPMIVPLRLGLAENALWTIPVEPMVSVSGGNVISKRTVAKGKGRGTIKERWSQDDYQINISGILMNYDDLNTYPANDVARLREICEAKQAIFIDCPALAHFNITRIVIESYDFPFTKGNNVQAYGIRAISDDITELLIYEDL